MAPRAEPPVNSVGNNSLEKALHTSAHSTEEPRRPLGKLGKGGSRPPGGRGAGAGRADACPRGSVGLSLFRPCRCRPGVFGRKNHVRGCH